MLICFLNTGAGRSEIFGLRWDDVDFKRGTVTLTTCKTKNGSPRRDTLDMSDELHQTLLSWKNSPHRRFKNSPYVFVRQRPGRNYGKPFTTRRTFMESLCTRAGVKPFGFHALRHHVASYLADKGVGTPEIQALLRHQSTTTTDRYIGRLRKGHKLIADAKTFGGCGEITRPFLPSRLAGNHPETSLGG